MNHSNIKYRYYKYYRRALQIFGRHIILDINRSIEKSILLAGTGRSGTTWLYELIASQLRCRLMFEPFHSNLVEEYSRFHYFQYMRSEEDDEDLEAFARKVFSGEIRHRWIDRRNQNILPHYRVIKEIRANLFLKWLKDHFPEISVFFIIRHPCAVVLSRMELGWATDQDIAPFLAQPKLIKDYLSNYLELIKNAKSEEEKHAIIWCVSNLVPLKQFKPNELNLIYYETLCLQPEKTLSEIMQSIGQSNGPMRSLHADRPSATCSPSSAVITGKDKISRWKYELSPQQISKILNVVSEFGLDCIYGKSSLPLNQ